MTAQTTYRVDFEVDGQIAVLIGLGHKQAMASARRLSAKHGVAYAIATADGKDIGQRVYCNGLFERQDEAFK